MQNAFVTSKQTIIAFDEYGSSQFPREIERRKVFETAADLVPFLGDETAQVLRMIDIARPDAIEATENLKIEDITEDCAMAWITAHQMRDDIDRILPLYVARSQAWEDWSDDHACGRTYSQLGHGTYSTFRGAVN